MGLFVTKPIDRIISESASIGFAVYFTYSRSRSLLNNR
jgi:hypothetical protein